MKNGNLNIHIPCKKALLTEKQLKRSNSNFKGSVKTRLGVRPEDIEAAKTMINLKLHRKKNINQFL